MMRELVILSGPTAAGKTALSIELAKRIGGEIISADSMQVYRHMDIGTAKITESEMCNVPHHLIDCREPFEEWSVGTFKAEADRAIAGIYERGHIPIIVGGTGFYIQSVLYDVNFSQEPEDRSVRTQLEEYYEKNGAVALHDMLKSIDEEAAQEIHANNVKRVIRAIEFYRVNGRKISEHNKEERMKTSPYNAAYFVLTMDREKLYSRIDRRVDIMVENGLLDEVRNLKEMGYDRSFVSMQGLGYKEILAYLDGEISLEESIDMLKRETRHFAKRQLTWFRRERDVLFIDKDKYSGEEQILEEMIRVLKEKNICQ